MSTLSIVNARIIDPATGYDDFGNVLIEDGHITAFGPHIDPEGDIVDAEGHLFCYNARNRSRY